jgi:hypothetical protein
MEQSYEPTALELLKQVAARNWPIIVHPDAMHTPLAWACLGDCLCIENMDKRKPIGQTATDLAKLFDALPNASLCFDIGHARQIDPPMSEAWAILQSFREKIKQLHVSEVNTQSKHDPIVSNRFSPSRKSPTCCRRRFQLFSRAESKNQKLMKKSRLRSTH